MGGPLHNEALLIARFDPEFRYDIRAKQRISTDKRVSLEFSEESRHRRRSLEMEMEASVSIS